MVWLCWPSAGRNSFGVISFAQRYSTWQLNSIDAILSVSTVGQQFSVSFSSANVCHSPSCRTKDAFNIIGSAIAACLRGKKLRKRWHHDKRDCRIVTASDLLPVPGEKGTEIYRQTFYACRWRIILVFTTKLSAKFRSNHAEGGWRRLIYGSCLKSLRIYTNISWEITAGLAESSGGLYCWACD